jgi:hypothetical protein
MGELDKYYWLFDDMKGMKEKIRFKDRIEYRVSGEIHNTIGPAIIEFGDEEKKTTGAARYFLKGQEYTEEDWNIAVRPVKLNRLKKKIDKKKNIEDGSADKE